MPRWVFIMPEVRVEMETITVARDGAVTEIALNRTEKLNAVNRALPNDELLVRPGS